MEGRDSMGLPSQGHFARPNAAPNSIVIHGASNVNMLKRKRGRPRKYGPDGGMALALSPFSALQGMTGSSSQKRGRGRPPGTGRKQQLAALGSAGVGFTPHVITIAPGEDIATKIMSFSQQGPRAVCILSAYGAISNVTVRQPAASGGTVTYEGRFDIVSLSGSFLLTENNGARSRTGGLSISLAGPDGRVVGGVVAGMLMAASPVQVIAGSFILDGKKVQGKPENPVSSLGLPHVAASGHLGAKHGGPGSLPFNPSSGAFGHSHHHHHHQHHHHHHQHHQENECEERQWNRAQKALLLLAKATGWANLADALRENFRLCCSSMVLLLLAAVCPYVMPKAASRSIQNALIALAFPLVGISAALDASIDIAGGRVNIHVLMTLAAFASVFMGNTLEGGLLLAMFNLAHIAEEYYTQRAMGDVKALKESNPEFALVLEAFDSAAPHHFSSMASKRIPVHDLEVGSYILVRAGEAVPVDGEVCQGISMVTVEHLTGEANPLEKQVGDSVPGGARNLDGMLIIKATKTWKDSTLSKIMHLAEEAQLNRPKLQRWLDEFGERYSQAVVVVSVVVALFGPFVFKWPFLCTPGARGSIYRALGLMVAASPCALAVAPVAYATAISACASKGILLKGGHALDALASCDIIAFDKTGTLTTGGLVCKGIEPIHGHSLTGWKDKDVNACCNPSCEKEALAVASAMEKGTTHPIARAVADHSLGKELPPVSIEHFESLPGKGLVATLTGIQSGDGVPLKATLGSLEYIASLFRNEFESRQIKEAASASPYGQDLVHAVLSVNNKVTLFHFEDKIRPGATDVVSTLKNQASLRLMMLTGDHASSASRVAKAVGIDEVHSGLKPEDKLHRVKSLSRDGAGGLIMVGDGINDAPALAAATVGIVLAQRASATAIAVADVLLLEDNIKRVPFVIAKARQTTSLVKQSVLLALSCIFFAALPSVMGFLPLWLTVLLHEGGTLLVCVNSARALNDPTWSWTHDLRRVVDDSVASISNILKQFSSSNNVQSAPS